MVVVPRCSPLNSSATALPNYPLLQEIYFTHFRAKARNYAMIQPIISSCMRTIVQLWPRHHSEIGLNHSIVSCFCAKMSEINFLQKWVIWQRGGAAVKRGASRNHDHRASSPGPLLHKCVEERGERLAAQSARYLAAMHDGSKLGPGFDLACGL